MPRPHRQKVDMKVEQAHRRKAFLARLRRKAGVLVLVPERNTEAEENGAPTGPAGQPTTTAGQSTGTTEATTSAAGQPTGTAEATTGTAGAAETSRTTAKGELADLAVGMEVFSADGKLLGVVDRVWPAVDPAEQTLDQIERGLPGHPLPGAPSDRWQPVETGYLRVDRGSPGPDQYLYVPFIAVRKVDRLDNRVELNVTLDEILQQGWEIRPHFLPGPPA